MRFPIILADPCWQYKNEARKGNRGAVCKYPVMTDAALNALPVGEIAEDTAFLFLWTTMPKLASGLALIKAWGFEYKTCAFTWVKPNRPFAEAIAYVMGPCWRDEDLGQHFRRVNTLWAIGMGSWTRANAELCLLGVKGDARRVDAGVNQIICAPSLKHSAKPAEVRDRIVRLCGDKPRVELFARDTAPGWVGLGNEIDGQDLRDSIPELARMGGYAYRKRLLTAPPADQQCA